MGKDWRPQGDLNPRRRRERAVSLAELDDGDAHGGEPSWDRTNDPLIKSQMLCQLSYGLPRNWSYYVPGGGSVKRGRDSSEGSSGSARALWRRGKPRRR